MIAVQSESDRRYEIGYLRRKARQTALDAGRAAPSLSMQLRLLAALFESQAEQLETHLSAFLADRDHVPSLA